MCIYKEFCTNKDCDGYPEESDLLYCLGARIKYDSHFTDNDKNNNLKGR